MKTSRQRIIDHLSVKRIASAIEISQTLGVTPANIRHHLHILLDEGAVEVASQRYTGGRGRPTQLYTLTHQARQHNLDKLASALLENYITSLPQDSQMSALQAIAQRLLSDDLVNISGNLTQRLYQGINVLNGISYQARWEAHAEAPHIILGHCPFAAILEAHPELCLLDAYLIEELLDVPVKQIEKLAQDDQGLVYCKFAAGYSEL